MAYRSGVGKTVKVWEWDSDRGLGTRHGWTTVKVWERDMGWDDGKGLGMGQ